MSHAQNITKPMESNHCHNTLLLLIICFPRAAQRWASAAPPPAGTGTHFASVYHRRAHPRRASGVGCMHCWADQGHGCSLSEPQTSLRPSARSLIPSRSRPHQPLHVTPPRTRFGGRKLLPAPVCSDWSTESL